MLLNKVKDKKEFRGLSDDFVSRVLVQCSEKYDVREETDQQQLLKDVRARLRELYSAFRMPGYDRKEKYLQKMQRWDDKEVATKILHLHLSTKERLPYYPQLYKKLRAITNFHDVLDLGCGMNVFSIPWMGRVGYYGVDVNKDDVEFCNAYLGKFKLTGGVRWGDLTAFDKFIHTDICFLFKVLEGFESLERGSAEQILDKVSSPYVVCSFATRTLSGGKPISERRLKWFEQLEPIHQKFKLGTEVYYVIKR